jgi:hypothetical protein
MGAALRRRQDVDLIFDGTSAKKRVPMVLACVDGKRCRDRYDTRSLIDEAPIKLRKPHIIANAKPNLDPEHLSSDDLAPRHRRRTFAIGRTVRQSHIEEVHLSVRRSDVASRIDKDRAVVGAGIGPGNAPSRRSAISLRVASSPMNAKFSGRATNSAPALAANATQCWIRDRFAWTFACELS